MQKNNPKPFPELKTLSHFAWKCRDVEETIDFYEEILGLTHITTIERDFITSTDEYFPHKQIVFELKDGSQLVFFDMGDDLGTKTDTDDWIVRIAIGIDSVDELFHAKNRLEMNGIGVLGPIEHELTNSIYFFDPNGLRIEVTAKNEA